MKGKFNLQVERKMYEFQRLIDEIFPKEVFYKKMFFGKGLEFRGYRDFIYNDDSSLIDWKASKRANHLLVKEYEEERNLNVMIVLDVGENMIFGSGDKLKCEYAVEIAVALAYVLLNKGDNVGFILYNNKVLKFSPPGKQLNDIRYEISNSHNYGGVSDLAMVLDKVFENLDVTTNLVFLISDFININQNIKKDIEKIGSFYEIIALSIKDPFDISLPEVNKEIVVEDIKTNQKLLLNPSIAKKLYEMNTKKQTNFVKELFFDSGIDYLELLTNEDFAPKLADFLKDRIIRRDD